MSNQPLNIKGSVEKHQRTLKEIQAVLDSNDLTADGRLAFENAKTRLEDGRFDWKDAQGYVGRVLVLLQATPGKGITETERKYINTLRYRSAGPRAFVIAAAILLIFLGSFFGLASR